MDIQELKSKIESNEVSDKFMIFVCADDTSRIITDQYIDLISSGKGLTKTYISNLDEIQDDGFIIDTNLYILNIDTWESTNTHDNCIVVCNKSIKSDYSIVIPKLQDWQLKDFISPKLPGLSQVELDYLYNKFNDSSTYRMLLNEVDKISIFSKEEQSQILSDMINDNQFKYVTDKTTFDFTNAIITKDIDKLNKVYADGDSVDITPMHIWTILINSFRNIINIQLNPNCTAKDLGISDKQFFVIKKYNCNIYSKDKLIEIMKMLTNIEFMFKFCELSMDDMIDYMVVNILRG